MKTSESARTDVANNQQPMHLLNQINAMKFIVSSSVLLKNLLTISGAIATNPIVPILENVLARLDEGNLTLTASDLRMTLIQTVPVESVGSGAIAIPAKLLLNTLRSLPDQPITISIDAEKFTAEIKTDNGTFRLACENAIDFPKIPEVQKIQSVLLPSDLLLAAIDNTTYAISGDDLRPAMTGVHLHLSGYTATFAATDGHRLVRYRHQLDATGLANENTSLIIPKKALLLLKKALPAGVDVEMQASPANAAFTFGPTRLICRLIDERFPDYENAIPTNNTSVMTIGRANLLSSLKRIAVYANKTTQQIQLSLTVNGLTMSAEDLDYNNEASEQVLCEYEGEPMEIGFNVKLFAESLASQRAKIIRLELSQPNRAAVIKPVEQEENEDLLTLVMPVMLNTYA